MALLLLLQNVLFKTALRLSVTAEYWASSRKKAKLSA
ncbi:hypothetical protein EVA_15102 [gut metagenome]|uniref:Uncharacterized protein n=1 Tax=gut metagenome TaxID=749906 RepID=J9GBJ9_9ZZZZ